MGEETKVEKLNGNIDLILLFLFISSLPIPVASFNFRITRAIDFCVFELVLIYHYDHVGGKTPLPCRKV